MFSTLQVAIVKGAIRVFARFLSRQGAFGLIQRIE